MIQRIKNERKQKYEAEFISNEQNYVGVMRAEWFEEFESEVDKIQDEIMRQEGYLVLNCIETGKKVEVKGDKIMLYTNKANLEHHPQFVITGNSEVYSLLEKIVCLANERKKRWSH